MSSIEDRFPPLAGFCPFRFSPCPARTATDRPVITADGTLSVRFEHTAAVTTDGVPAPGLRTAEARLAA